MNWKNIKNEYKKRKKILFYSTGVELQHNYDVCSAHIGLRQRMHMYCVLRFICDGHTIQFLFSVIYSWQVDRKSFSRAGGWHFRIWSEAPLWLERRWKNKNLFLLQSKQKTRIIQKVMNTKPVYHSYLFFSLNLFLLYIVYYYINELIITYKIKKRTYN